ncbi:anti-silencing ASF1 family protein [Babesia ovis]|uniref:Anti-silencing ASF1 family protein n=1 Tax=Babesia ovis TaxID=5869 RepID=A0A9W5TE25_BABOV|nr:anti-silencing ASF1 family protein [Babesia ovis]
MSLINVTNITVGNNVCPVTAPLVFQIEFECLEDLKHDVEWKIIYVTSDGSGYQQGQRDPLDESQPRDGEIVLDAVCLGPIYRGVLEFEFRVAPPDFTRLNPGGILGMQAVLVTASYCDQEFIRIGYYTNNCYDDPELRECPPDTPNIDKMVRCIIDQPRVTRFPIRWDNDGLIDPDGNDISSVINDQDAATSDEEPQEEDKELSNNLQSKEDTHTEGHNDLGEVDEALGVKRGIDEVTTEVFDTENRKVHRSNGLVALSTNTSISEI